MRRVVGWVLAAFVAWLGGASAGHAKQAAVCKAKASVNVEDKGLRGLVVGTDGTLWVGGVDGNIRQVDAQKGKVLRTLKGHKAEVYALALSPDGRTLASGSDDKKVMLWDTGNGKALGTLEGHQNTIKGLAFSTDGTTLYSASLDRQLGNWNVPTAKLNQFLGGQACVLQGVAVTTGTLKTGAPAAATACNDGLVRLWDLRTGKPKVAMESHDSEVHGVAFASGGDNPLLATGDTGGKVVVWDIQAQKSVVELEAAWTDVVAFTPDGTMLVAAGNDMAQKGLFRLWSIPEGKLLNEQSPHDGNITGAAFSRDGKTLFTAAMDGTIKAWHVAALKKGC